MPYLRRRNRRFADAGADYSTEVAGSNYERYYGLPNVFIGGNWAHGVARGNNYVLSRPPDWHDLLSRKDDNQQLASFVHDYQLATAKNWFGVRWAHRNYAENMSTNVHPMGPGFFRELSHPGRSKLAGFVPHNLKPTYGIPDVVWNRLNIGDEGRHDDHFNHYDGVEESFGIAEAENFSGDNDAPLNLHIDHKNMMSASKNFGDTRKQATTNVQVGSGSSLHSVPSILDAFYKGSRTLSTTWHHSGTSAMNIRSVFTYAFRHTMKTPWIGDNLHTHPNNEFVLSPSIVVQNPTLNFTDGTTPVTLTTGAFKAPSGDASPDTVEVAIPKELNPNSWDGDIPVRTIVINSGTDNQATFVQDPNLKDDFKILYLENINRSVGHLKDKPDNTKFYWINNETGLGTSLIQFDDLSLAEKDVAAQTSGGTYLVNNVACRLPTVHSKDYRLGLYRQVVKSGVNVISPERPVLAHSVGFSKKVDQKDVLFNNSTWYSPYCLQELETLSWNLNRMKLLPSPKGNYNKDSITNLPGRLKKDAILSADDFVSDYTDLIHPDDVSTLSNAFGVFKDVLYDSKGVSDVSPICQLGRRYGKTSFSDIDVNSLYPRSNPTEQDVQLFATSKDVSIADFYAQLGRSVMSFTFVNTGDTTMIVDAVVHRGKEHMSVGVNSPSTEAVGGDMPLALSENHLDLTTKLTIPYCNNYIAYHRSNQNRKVSDEVPVALDCLYDPDTKFIPTSYRLPKAGDAPGNLSAENDDGEAIDIVETVSFIDVSRRRIIVMPNSRKTMRFVIPTKAYIPADCDYTGLINEESVAITFGVTGKTTKVVADTKGDKLASQAVGRTAAPTSFQIIGSEVQQVYPCAIKEFIDQYKQIHSLPDPELAKGQDKTKGLHAAVYIGPNVRDIKSRYAHLMIDDGSMTRAQAAEDDAADVADAMDETTGVKRMRTSAGGNTTISFPDQMDVNIIGSDTGVAVPVSGTVGVNNFPPGSTDISYTNVQFIANDASGATVMPSVEMSSPDVVVSYISKDSSYWSSTSGINIRTMIANAYNSNGHTIDVVMADQEGTLYGTQAYRLQRGVHFVIN